MRLITTKILAHILLSIWVSISLMFVAIYLIPPMQYALLVILPLVWLGANAWIAMMPEYDYKGNP